MVSSHLARLGVTTLVLEDESALGRFLAPDEFLIIDDQFLIDYPQLVSRVREMRDSRILVLVPLAGSPILSRLDGLKLITKPVTIPSLYEAARGVVAMSRSLDRNAHASVSELTGGKGRVLVAEDVETNQRIATEMLELLDFEVDIAENGAIAVEKFKAGPYLAIFMDCQMPVMDGFAATEEIRRIERAGQLAPTPVIALTAGIGKEDRQRCEAAGMNDYLSKPFSLSELGACLGQLSKGPQNREGRGHQGSLQLTNSDASTKDAHNVDTEIFNMRAIDNIREVEKQTGKTLLPIILTGFKDQMDDKLRQISCNLHDGDTENLSRTAHAIKSMSANIGAERVRSISALIESKGRKGDTSDGYEAIRMLQLAYTEFVEEFDQAFIES
jgi:CheY-like chemotaxis protein